MSDKKWVIRDEWRKLSDEWWKKKKPNKSLASLNKGMFVYNLFAKNLLLKIL